MQRLRFVDLATLAYLGAVAALLVVARQRASSAWLPLLPLHAAAATGILWIARKPRSGIPGTIRELYPLPLFLGLYRESAALNHAVFARPLDALFLRAEQRWFGFQPSLAFAEHLPATAFAEVLYAGYFSFYIMILGVGIRLAATDRPAARRFMGTLAAVFFACYAVFIVFPVVGPRVLETHGIDEATLRTLGIDPIRPMPPGTQVGPFARLMALLYAWFEGDGGAFPSSHVIVACLTLRESFRHRFRIRWIHAVAVVALCFGTVYGRYHYVSDVVAGLVLAPGLIAGAEWMQRRWPGSDSD